MSSEQAPTQFEQGYKAGQWTRELLKECGFTSAQKCLDDQEKAYQKELATAESIRSLNPAYAAQHVQYAEGVITAERKSLGKLIAQEAEGNNG